MIEYPTRYDPTKTGYHFLSWVPEQGLFHPGNDFNYGEGNQDEGQDVIAPTWGIVLYASTVGYNEGLGGYIVINHPHNAATTRYMHLEGISVKQGDKVYPKQVIGKLGKQGNAPTAHLHFETLNEQGVNFIGTGSLPYGRYTKGLSKQQVQQYWIDPINWLNTQNHYVGQDLQQKLEQEQNALKFVVPPRRNVVLRLIDRLQKLTNQGEKII